MTGRATEPSFAHSRDGRGSSRCCHCIYHGNRVDAHWNSGIVSMYSLVKAPCPDYCPEIQVESRDAFIQLLERPDLSDAEVPIGIDTCVVVFGFMIRVILERIGPPCGCRIFESECFLCRSPPFSSFRLYADKHHR
jgi:hypothetical protein